MLVLTTSMEGPARRRSPYFHTKKVGIIGCTQSVIHTPWTDASWTLVSHASARQHCKREPDWWIDLHRRECFQAKKAWNRRYWEWLSTTTTPVFMQDNYTDVPAAVKFPKERLLGEFRPYFTNHVAWLIALAMTEGVHTIGLFGCQYAHDSEYGKQRGSCEYWLGRFEQAGGHVVSPKPNTLLCRPQGLYGYESHDEEGRLTPEYRGKPSVPKVTSKGEDDGAQPLTILADDAPMPAHRDIGQPPALDRSPWRVPELVAV